MTAGLGCCRDANPLLKWYHAIGNVPKHTARPLLAHGVASVVLPGASSEHIVSPVRTSAHRRAA